MSAAEPGQCGGQETRPPTRGYVAPPTTGCPNNTTTHKLSNTSIAFKHKHTTHKPFHVQAHNTHTQAQAYDTHAYGTQEKHTSPYTQVETHKPFHVPAHNTLSCPHSVHTHNVTQALPHTQAGTLGTGGTHTEASLSNAIGLEMVMDWYPHPELAPPTPDLHT